MTYRAVFIDWDGTLSTSRFWANTPYFEIIQRNIFQPRHPLIQEWMTGRLTTETATKKISAICSINHSRLINDLIENASKMRLTDPAILEHISKLRAQGVKVAIATDNMDSFHRWTVPALKLERHFDAILNSAQIGVLKANPHAFFSGYLSEAGLDPAQCLLVDDSPANRAIISFGLQFHRISSPEEATQIIANLL